MGDTQAGTIPSCQLGDTEDRFTASTAAVSGKSERAVQRDAGRGEKIPRASVISVV